MNFFSNWTGSDRFTAEDAAALIVGENARVAGYVRTVSGPVYESMARSYNEACKRADPSNCADDSFPPIEPLHSLALLWPEDVGPRDAGHTLFDWLRDAGKSGFEHQEFTRQELSSWLTATGTASRYAFDPDAPAALPTGIDPADLPAELDAAMLAFRAVSNGYGDQADTFKNRLTAYLGANYAMLTPTQRERIATVANPDKAAGRPSKSRE